MLKSQETWIPHAQVASYLLLPTNRKPVAGLRQSSRWHWTCYSRLTGTCCGLVSAQHRAKEWRREQAGLECSLCSRHYASHGQIWDFINPVHNLSRRFSLMLLENEDFPRTFLLSSLFYQWKNWAQRSSVVCTSPRSKQVAATQATQSSASRFNALSVSPPLARVPLTQNSHWK